MTGERVGDLFVWCLAGLLFLVFVVGLLVSHSPQSRDVRVELKCPAGTTVANPSHFPNVRIVCVPK